MARPHHTESDAHLPDGGPLQVFTSAGRRRKLVRVVRHPLAALCVRHPFFVGLQQPRVRLWPHAQLATSEQHQLYLTLNNLQQS